MIFLDLLENERDIFWFFDMNETCSILLHSRKSMEVLYEMLACLHHSFSFFPFPEQVSMLLHGLEDLTECRFIIPREKTPRIAEARSSDHEAIEIMEDIRYEISAIRLIFLSVL